MAKFIGKDALEGIAVKYENQILMGGVYYRKDVFEQLRIKVIEGVQFKQVAYVMKRKGHTTRRKVVGEEMKSTVGYLEERPMVGHLSWNRFMDNRDNYLEDPVPVQNPDHSSAFSYPLSEIAFKAALANYGEDIFDCLIHGDDTIDNKAPNAYLNLYTGLVTYLNNDVAAGRISYQLGNYVKVPAFEAPATPEDKQAFDSFVAFRDAWTQNLKTAETVMVYCSDKCGLALRDAYSNSKTNHKDVIDLDNGNFRFPLWPNIVIAPNACFGEGWKMIATVPENFEYGVDTLNSKSKITVQVGSDNDTEDIFFQVQSIQGTRVRNINPSAFCMTDDPLTPTPGAGDVRANYLIAAANDEKMGKVTVDGVASDPNKEIAVGKSCQLKATANPGFEFVQWSNGSKEATLTVVKKDSPEAFVAFFKATE